MANRKVSCCPGCGQLAASSTPIEWLDFEIETDYFDEEMYSSPESQPQPEPEKPADEVIEGPTETVITAEVPEPVELEPFSDTRQTFLPGIPVTEVAPGVTAKVNKFKGVSSVTVIEGDRGNAKPLGRRVQIQEPGVATPARAPKKKTITEADISSPNLEVTADDAMNDFYVDQGDAISRYIDNATQAAYEADLSSYGFHNSTL